VKPATEKRNTCLRPIRPASQPLSGIMIAAAMMYEVSTQAIWSWVAENEPCMRGSATLAMVLSSVCIIVAAVSESKIRVRRGPSISRAA